MARISKSKSIVGYIFKSCRSFFFLRNGINGQLDIYSIGGAKAKSQDYLVGDQVEVSMLEKGVYVLKLTSNDSYSLVFVKQ